MAHITAREGTAAEIEAAFVSVTAIFDKALVPPSVDRAGIEHPPKPVAEALKLSEPELIGRYSVARTRVAALYRASKVGLVPAPRWHEPRSKRIHRRPRPQRSWRFILSQFAVTTEDMSEALIVNPYDMSVVECFETVCGVNERRTLAHLG